MKNLIKKNSLLEEIKIYMEKLLKKWEVDGIQD